MCIKIISKINLFNRDPTKISKIDIICSYIFIILFLFVIIFYTKQYYDIVKHDLELCNKNHQHNSHLSCLNTEMTIIIVPYIGTIYGFFQSLYKITDLIAFTINCLCCCSSIVTNNQNPNEITIEMNNINI